MKFNNNTNTVKLGRIIRESSRLREKKKKKKERRRKNAR